MKKRRVEGLRHGAEETGGRSAALVAAVCAVWLVFAGCGAEPDSSRGDETTPGHDAGDAFDAADPTTPIDVGSDAEDGDAVVPPRDTGRLDIPVLPPDPDDARPAPGPDAGMDIAPSVPDLAFDDPPWIDGLTPREGSTLGGDLLVVEGDRFTWDMEVRLGGVLHTRVDVIDAYTLVFFTEPLPAGLHDLKLVTPGGSASLDDAFRAVSPARVDAVEPSEGGLRGGETVTVYGAGFTETTRLFFGAREARIARWTSDAEVEVEVPPGGRAGATDVIAVGERPSSLRDGYRYLPSPSLQALVPSVGSTEGGALLRLDGQGIDEACTLWLGAASSSVTMSEDGWPVAVLPPGSPGRVAASLDCGTRGEFLLADAFLYIANPSPGLARVWPASGFTSGGEVVTLSGFALEDTTAVYFGDSEARVLAVYSDRVDVLSPAGPPSSTSVRLDSPRGAEVLSDAWRWFERPVFDALVPGHGPVLARWDTTLEGRGLDAVASFELDGRTMTASDRTTDRASLGVPPGFPGSARLWARVGPLRLDTGLDVRRTERVAVDRVTPTTVPIAGGTHVYILGDGFDRTCEVRIGDDVVATEVVASGLLRVTAPPSDPGPVPLSVDGCVAWDLPGGLMYFNPARVPAGVSGGSIDGEIRVTVLEAGTNAPVEDASVMVSVRDSSPWVALTDVRGQATFTDERLVGPQTVTAFAPGRSAESYVDVNARDITFLLNPLPQPPCDPRDPACQPPPAPPRGTIQGFLTGLRKTAVPPPGTRLWATVETTRQSPGFVNPDPGPLGQLTEDGAFSIISRLGDVALVALCGYRFDAPPNQFVPLSMGVVRGVQLRPDRTTARTTIECDIPLDQEVSVKLSGAPTLIPPDVEPGTNPFPGRYQARFSFDFGGEGVFESLPNLVFQTSTFTGGRFPSLDGPLAGVRMDLVAGAYPRVGNSPSAEAWLRNVSRYGDLLVFPELLAVPEFTIPAATETRLVDGYIEWTMDALSRDPDYFYVFATSPSGGFPRWTLYLPGAARSFNFADYPEFSDRFGVIPGPGQPVEALSLFIRATDAVVFDFDDFDRVALRNSTWRAASTAFRYLTLVGGPLTGE